MGIVIFGLLIYWMILITIVIKRKKKLMSFAINGIINLAYTSYFLYCLMYDSEGGMALVWWFYILVFTGLHKIVSAIELGYIIYKRKVSYNKIAK